MFNNENQATRDLLKLHFAPKEHPAVEALRARAAASRAKIAAMSPEELDAFMSPISEVHYVEQTEDERLEFEEFDRAHYELDAKYRAAQAGNDSLESLLGRAPGGLAALLGRD